MIHDGMLVPIIANRMILRHQQSDGLMLACLDIIFYWEAGLPDLGL